MSSFSFVLPVQFQPRGTKMTNNTTDSTNRTNITRFDASTQLNDIISSTNIVTQTIVNAVTENMTLADVNTPNITFGRTFPPFEKEKRDLLWIIPAVFGIIIFLGGVACMLLFVLRKTEILCIQYCLARCGCCEKEFLKRKRKSYNQLEEEGGTEKKSLRLDKYNMKGGRVFNIRNNSLKKWSETLGLYVLFA